MKKTFIAVMILVVLTLPACGGQPVSKLPDDAYVTTSCIAISASKPGNILLKGIAVLDDYKNVSDLTLLNLADKSLKPLSTPDETIGQMMVSPDQKALAFQIGDPKTNTWSLVIADGQGNRAETIPWQQGFFTMGGWINNTQLLISTNPPLLVFNPYTGEQIGFDYSDLPNYMVDTIGNRYAFFDPGLTRVLYKNQDDQDSLLDLTSNTILAEVDNHPDPAPIAAWTSDGSQVAVVGTLSLGAESTDIGHDIFGISRAGQIKQLTHLTEHYGKQLTISPSGLSWSPDSRYLAFWIIYPDSPAGSWQLAVYDTVAQKTTDYCIPSIFTSMLTSIHPLPAPIWSPDGRQIMVENRYDQSSSHLVILDLGQKAAFKVRDNVYPAGWLVSGTP